MASCAWRQLATASRTGNVSARRPIPKSAPWINFNCYCSSKSSHPFTPHSLHWSRDEGRMTRSEVVAMATPEREGIVPSRGDDDDDGVSLGTRKFAPEQRPPAFRVLALPVPLKFDKVPERGSGFITIGYGETEMLVHISNNLPLPVPLKFDKVPERGSGFITIGYGETEMLVHIDCLVFPPEDGSSLVFTAAQ